MRHVSDHNPTCPRSCNCSGAGISTRALANGVLSESQLQQKFLDVKRDVLRVQLVPPAGGLIAHLVSAVVSHLLIRRKGPVTGTAPDAVVSRAEFFIQQGNLEDATRELNQLEGVQREAAWEWLEESRAHLEVRACMSQTHPALV